MKLALGILTSLVLGTIISFILPESPRYLVATGQLEQAQNSYEFVARMNRASPGLVSLERLEALFSSRDESGLFKHRIGVSGVQSFAEARDTLERAVANVVSIEEPNDNMQSDEIAIT